MKWVAAGLVGVLLLAELALLGYRIHLKPMQSSVEHHFVVNVNDINLTALYNLTNQDRAKAGLPALTLNPKLNASAQAKCSDMVAKNYWAHNNPAGQTPWHFFTDAGVPYIHMGENLARGQISTDIVNTQWMNSPEHKANILDPKYTDVGFAVCKGTNPSAYLNPAALLTVEHFAQL